LTTILRALPDWVPLDVEVPLTTIKGHSISALGHARRAVRGARQVMALAGRE